MQSLFAVLSGAAVVAILAANAPFTQVPDVSPAAESPFATARVMVHCRAGNTPAFVTPVRVRIALGDTVEWRAAGNIVTDSIFISLKDSTQTWPFEGTPSSGGPVTRTLAAVTPGTYGYNVTVLCRVPGGGVQREVIDPDIIIGE